MRLIYGKMIAIFAVTLGISGCTAAKNEISEDLVSEQSERVENSEAMNLNQELQEENSIPMIINFSTEEEEFERGANNKIDIIGEVDSETSEKFKGWKENLISYLNKIGVDTSQMPDIKAYWCEIDGTALGYYGDNEMFLNKDLTSNEKELQYVYTHESMHYFIPAEKDVMLSEGFCDFVAKEVTGYDENIYVEPEIFCHQLVIADPDIIKYICEGGNIGNRINERLKNIKREWYVPEHNLEPSEIVDFLLIDVFYDNDLNDENFAYCLYQIQEIVWAYCNTFNLTDFQIQLLEENSFGFNF